MLLQYDEFDNAALTMIAHSPMAWDHVHFKDVLVKVSNVEVYYKAIGFYLAEHPDLLVDMLKVISRALKASLPLHCHLPATRDSYAISLMCACMSNPGM